MVLLLIEQLAAKAALPMRDTVDELNGPAIVNHAAILSSSAILSCRSSTAQWASR
jgi:hypothetical protein